MSMREVINPGVLVRLAEWEEARPGRHTTVDVLPGAAVALYLHDGGTCALEIASDAGALMLAAEDAITKCERELLAKCSSAEASALDRDRAPDSLPPPTLETGRAAE